LLIIVTATILTYCWNRLVKDSTLPRLTHPKAIGFAFLGGLLFFLVLVMIAGSRELLSPGEWRPNGILYKLNTPPEPPVLSAGFDPDTLIPLEDSPEARLAVRRENLIRLRSALWKYADENGGNFPDAIPQTLHVIPVSGGVKYRYAPHDGAFLVLEPDLNEPPRLGLNRQGVIVEYQDQSNNTEGQ
ncbi:MAG: hypothetical protein LBI05_00090, partial [Planctomycetaceae bacterium]|nr:hypothetical protein [Planctomycetaceae bacterium]